VTVFNAASQRTNQASNDKRRRKGRSTKLSATAKEAVADAEAEIS
jgi:hypothetical protein